MKRLHSHHQSRMPKMPTTVAALFASYLADRCSLTLCFRSFRFISSAFLAFFAAGTLAHDAWPKRELKTKTEFAKYRDEAWAHFKKRCNENARETISRVVTNVDAIFLIKLRRRATERDLVDQYWMGDPYGYSLYEAMNPIGIYLHDRSGRTVSGRTFTPLRGYKYVETLNPEYREGSTEARYLRYALQEVEVLNSVTRKLEKRIKPRAESVLALLSRYGVTWEDISTATDREYWVAGGRLAVLDLQTNEVIGERIGYVIDPGLGSTAQGRRIWLAVGRAPHAFCPRFENDFDRNKEFVAKVLRASPRRGDAK